MRTSTMIGRFSVCLTLTLPLFAHAQENPDPVAKILASAPLPCIDSAMSLANRQFAAMGPDRVLDEIRIGSNLDSSWAPGNANYVEARAIVAKALAEDEKKDGPIFFYNTEMFVRQGFSSSGPDDMQFFSTFFTKPEGKLYWHDVVDGVICKLHLDSLNGQPFRPLEGADKAKWQKLEAEMPARDEHFNSASSKLTKQQMADFTRASDKLNQTFANAMTVLANQQGSALQGRVSKILGTREDDIKAVIAKYHPS